jgi:uncharacterized protein (UPF0332 family)
MSRAREALEEAGLLFEKGHTNTAVNRLYYAAFYAVSAARLARGFSSSKHSGVRALLHRELVRSGRVPRELGRFFDTLFDSRQKGDYADLVNFEAGDVEPWFALTRDLVDASESCLPIKDFDRGTA